MSISPTSTSIRLTSTAAWATTCKWSPGGEVAIGINAIGYREVLGNSLEEGFAYAVAIARPRPSGVSFWARSSPNAQWERGLTGTRLVGSQLL